MSTMHWAALQKRVFSRFLSQKMAMAGSKLRFTADTLLTAFDTGYALAELLEVLSGNKMANKEKKVSAESKSKGRIQQLNSATEAINFALDAAQGVKITLKPSAANLVDGDELSVMGMVWCIIRSYLKFGEDDDTLSAEEALLRWVKKIVTPYGVVVEDFSQKSWGDGRALCALVHSQWPEHIGDFAALSPADAINNIDKAQKGAEAAFRLERYLTPEEVQILDTKSMVVYVAEYYAGIVGRARLLAGVKRVADLIAFTQENDRMRDEYTARAIKLKAQFDPAVALLTDTAVDNTLAGAQSKLAAFLHFKEQVKDGLTSEFLSLEQLMSVLATRLAAAARPPFVPAEGLTIPELRGQFVAVESAEAARHAALLAELNRQLALARQAAQHAARCGKLGARLAEIEAAAAAAVAGDALATTAGAKFQSNALTALADELATLRSDTLAAIQSVGAALAADKYEGAADVAAREQALAAQIAALESATAAKQGEAASALALNTYKDEVASLAAQHKAREGKLLAWLADISAQIAAPADTATIVSTQGALSALAVLVGEFAEHADNRAAFLAIGAKVKGANHGAWLPAADLVAAVNDAEDGVNAQFDAVEAALSAKKATLEAALAANVALDGARLAWTMSYGAFAQFVKDTISTVQDADFGCNTAEVAAYDVATENAAVEAAVAAKVAALQGALADANVVGSANPYTTANAASVAALQQDVAAALAARSSAYAAASAKFAQEDALCAAFAAVANPLVAFIASAKDSITNSSAPVAEQQTAVAAAKAAYAADTQLAAAQAAWAPVEAAGIQSNPHTLSTGSSLAVQWEQYRAFLDTKDGILAELAETQALRGLSKELWAEAQATFSEFDKAGAGALNAEGLRSALFALGESRKKAEAESIVATFGADGTVTFTQFMDYLVVTLGGANSRAKIEEAFALVCNGSEARLENMEGLFSAADLAYIAKTAPKDENGNVDVQAWIAEMYSR